MIVPYLISFAQVALLFSQITFVTATTYLSPIQDIVLPASESAIEPLEWLGANSPYFAGPSINGISNEVPEGCYVEQVAYLVRHGSRYPDSGAYAQWTALYEKIQAANFTATGSLKFLEAWKPVLTNPAAQISQESPTGYKEAYDFGYQLRTRYPALYTYGTPFMSWANLYPRVVQTAQNFVRGFLGSTASSFGVVFAVNSTGSSDALFDSLSPSDQCPLFIDGNGGTEQSTWNSLYLPPILNRLNTMLAGNLNFTTTDVSIMPYLCGFESQIMGTLSPWCSVFTDAELKQYEYAQDLRYYYGMGPGVNLASKMMLPFVNSLVGLLAQGPGTKGTFANGSSYVLPDILTAFMNDGQITEVGAAIGVWDGVTVLSGTKIPYNHTYIASHFVSMRGTVAFERLNCASAESSRPKVTQQLDEVDYIHTNTKTETTYLTNSLASSGAVKNAISTILPTSNYTVAAYKHEGKSCSRGQEMTTIITSKTMYPISIANTSTYITSTILSTSTYEITSCNHNAKSCHVGGKTTTVATFKSVYPISAIATEGLSSPIPSPSIKSPISSFTTTTVTSSTATSLPSSTATSTNQIFIRLLLNDAVYLVPSCQSGPGSSCPVSEYVDFIAARLAAAGDLRTRCNVTNPAAPTVLKGASFFTNLGESWIASVMP